MHHVPRVPMRQWLVPILAATSVLPLLFAPGVRADSPRIIVVRLENLTSTQPLTPPVLAVHNSSVDLLEVGQLVTEGVRYIAEDGNNEPLIADLQQNPGVFHIVVMGDHQVHPLDFGEVDIEAPEGARLSLVSMLSCTNDGFVAVDSWPIPDGEGADFGTYTMDLNALDAGSEENTEKSVDFVDPCRGTTQTLEETSDDGNNRVPTFEPIHPHPGIKGIGDHPVAAYGWTDPTARVTITAREGEATKDPPPNIEQAERTAWIAYVLGGTALAFMATTGIVLSRRR